MLSILLIFMFETIFSSYITLIYPPLPWAHGKEEIEDSVYQPT